MPRDRCSNYDVSTKSSPLGISQLLFNFRELPMSILSSDCTVLSKQGIIAVVRSMKFMQPFAQEDIVLLAPIPDYPGPIARLGRAEVEVEVSKEAWLLVCEVIRSVTIALESGVSPKASRLVPTDDPVAGAIDQPLLPFNRAKKCHHTSTCECFESDQV